jgi:ADP-heptose:LPS heptosyltransferase
MRLSAMGDVAITVPVLRAFVEQNPDVKITVISRPFFQPFFEGIHNLSFFTFDEKQRHKGFIGLSRLFQDLLALNIDAFADLHNVLRSKVVRTLFSLSGKRTAFVDKGRAEKAALTRAENKIFKPLPTMFERHVKVFNELGFTVDLSNPTFPKKAVLDNDILKMLVGNEKIPDFSGIKIGIAPFAHYDSKVYPFDLMQEVIHQLTKSSNYKILLFGGGKKEIELLEKLSKDKKNVVVVAGQLEFHQELQLISNLDIMLSMDSANAHIAAMLDVKVITLWGTTHPFAGFSPFNQPLENALVSDRNLFPKLPTSVYGNKLVAGYEDTMRTITVESVIDKINLIIKQIRV